MVCPVLFCKMVTFWLRSSMCDVCFRQNWFWKLQWESVGMVVTSPNPVSKSAAYSGCFWCEFLPTCYWDFAQWSPFHGLCTWTFSSSWTSKKMMWMCCCSVGGSSYACTVFRSHACTCKKIAWSDTVDQNSSVNSSTIIWQEVRNALVFKKKNYHVSQEEVCEH